MQYGKSQEAVDRLTAEQRSVTQEAGTERPFTGEYNDHKEPGIYVSTRVGYTSENPASYKSPCRNASPSLGENRFESIAIGAGA